jgi:hypothetical protein
MESVGILAPIQFEQGGGKAQVRRERVLDQDSVNGRVRIEAFRRPTRTGFQWRVRGSARPRPARAPTRALATGIQ